MSLRGKSLVFGDEVGQWVWDQLSIPPKPCAAIGLTDGKGLLAGVAFTGYYRGASIEMTIASVGRMWAMPEFFRCVFAYPFRQLDCKRATAVVASRNWKSRRLCEHLGFVQEGFLKFGFPDDDAVVYGIYRDCRWANDHQNQV